MPHPTESNLILIYRFPVLQTNPPGTRLQSQREGIESRTNKIFVRLENLRFKIYTWVDKMRNQNSPIDEFKTQFSMFNNAINELTTFVLMNRVPMLISRDISDLNDVIIKCKCDRLRNLDPRNDRPGSTNRIQCIHHSSFN